MLKQQTDAEMRTIYPLRCASGHRNASVCFRKKTAFSRRRFRQQGNVRSVRSVRRASIGENKGRFAGQSELLTGKWLCRSTGVHSRTAALSQNLKRFSSNTIRTAFFVRFLTETLSLSKRDPPIERLYWESLVLKGLVFGWVYGVIHLIREKSLKLKVSSVEHLSVELLARASAEHFIARAFHRQPNGIQVAFELYRNAILLKSATVRSSLQPNQQLRFKPSFCSTEGSKF